MTLEIIIFVSAILFGFFWYWRESKNNSVYRFVNKLFYSDDLQMKPNNKKGFVFKQNVVFRLVYSVIFFVVLAAGLQFLTPLRILNSYYGISAFASSVFGTLLGTYLANVVIASSNVIEEKSDDIEHFVKEKLEDGKEFIEHLGDNKNSVEDVKKPLNEALDKNNTPSKSGRDRLKDKGYL